MSSYLIPTANRSRRIAPVFPQTLPTLAAGSYSLWLKGQGPLDIATGVKDWYDALPAKKVAVQATGSKQPAFNASGGPNSLPCVTADGTDDTMAVTFTLTNPWHIFAVLKWGTFGAAATAIDSATAGNINFYRNSATQVTYFLAAGTVVTPTSWHYYTIANTAGTGTVKQDNSLILSGAANGNSQPGLSLFTYGDGASNPANASLAELIVTTGITEADEANIVTYIRLKTGL